MKYLLAGLLLTAILFAGCEKSKLIVNTGDTLDSVTIANTADNKVASTVKYRYNSNNSISSITQSSVNATYVYSYSYNAQGKLLTMQTNINTTGPLFLDSVVYDGAGRIVKKINKALQPNFGTSDHLYTYNAQGKLVADSLQISTSSGPYISSYTVFEYNGDNIAVAKKYYAPFRSSPLTLQGTETYTNYDSKTNPYYKNGIAHLLRDDWAPFSLSKNNVLSAVYTEASSTSGNPSYSLKSISYFDNDLPLSIIYKGVANSSDVRYEFKYR